MQADTPSRTTDSQLYRFLRRALFWLRWATLIVLLAITFMQPADSRIGLPTWGLLLLFAAYSLLGDLVRLRLSGLHALAYGAVLDLPIAALLYFLAAEPGGPLIVLLFLAVDYAAASLTLRGTLFYTAAVASIAAGIDFSLHMGAPTPGDIRMLVARLVMLGLVGIGMAIVTRRLVMQQTEEQSVRDEAGRLEELERLRSTFISTVSHDLRTPLTATRAGLGLLETSLMQRLQPSEHDLLRNIRRNTEQLNVLIDDLLAYNQLEAGTLHLEREPLDLRAVVTDALSAIYPLVTVKEQMLEVDLPEPLLVAGDQQRLEQVIINLLANSYRHTPAGTRITVFAMTTNNDVQLSVRDNGPGIPIAEREAIFKRFHRLDLTYGGSGLGLAIAKSIVELHGGRIWVESEPGAGATFHIVLPAWQKEE